MTKIIKDSALNQYRENMSAYAVYVNRKRMIPNVKDGLKTIHRRILTCAYYDEKAIDHNIKSAAIVGTTMKKMHPHGDSSIYDAMQPMTNWFEIMLPLLQGKGNWGNFQGDSKAHHRYTESRVSPFAVECVIGELKDTKEVVDWVETYDGRALEPEFLPVAVPLLLINGTFGIGVGLRSDLPKHNVNEVIDATLKLIANPNAEVVLVPDQCMPCDIIDTNWKSICNKGNGKFRVRGLMDISTVEEGRHKGKPVLIIRSTPDMVFLNSIIDVIEKLISDKKLIQIEDMYDDTENNDMRFHIVLKKGADPNFVRDVIYKNTLMDKGFSVNFEVLDGIEPLRMSYKSYLLSFIEFRKITKFRLYCNKLQNVQTKLHEKIAFIKVIQSGEIDNIIKMIRGIKHTDENYLVEYLIKTLGITDLQASFIIRSDLRKLSLGYLDKFIEESIGLEALKAEYLNKITNDEILIQEIVAELKMYKKKYGKPRNARLIEAADLSNIPKGEFKVVITENNFIKKVPINDMVGKFRGDTPKMIIKGDNRENVLLFDEQGKVFKLPLHKIPFSDRNSNGTDVRTLIKGLTSNINKVIYEPVLKELSTRTVKTFVTILTAGGNIKKLDIEDFLAVPPSGIFYIKLDPTDSVKAVALIPEYMDIIVYSKHKALRMALGDVPHQKRNTKGMRSMTEEEVDGLALVDESSDIIVVTETGKVNKFNSLALPNLGRNKAGTRIIKLSKDDSIKFVAGANDNKTLRVTTRNEVFEFKVSEIKPGSSVSAGNKLIPLKGDNIIRCDIINKKGSK